MAEEEAADTAEAKEQITVAADKAEEQGVANVVRKKQSCKYAFVTSSCAATKCNLPVCCGSRKSSPTRV